nr:flippase-like domain-containing protein [Thermoleophilaceae bacterium]
LQYKMLVQAGSPPASVAGAITAVNLLVFAVVLALPVLAIPTFLAGSVDDNLVKATLIGVGVFVAITAFGALFFTTDAPLVALGRAVQRARNRMFRRRAPIEGVSEGLLRERDRILATLGPRWKRALLATVGRWAFDYGTLLAALAALGSHPRPALVLLAFCAAQVLAQIPFTPGGLGFVEAGMTATLALAGVPAGTAVLATFGYRLFTYWLPLPVGLAAAGFHRRRFRRQPDPTPA